MLCANPDCRAMADDLMKGILTLVEFETPPDDRISDADGGFPVCSTRTRYFWLCEKCSYNLAIRKWNASGLILEPIYRNVPSESQSGRKPASAGTPAGPGLRYGQYRMA